MSYKNKKIWAIIPARGGSKGIPKKNIVNVAGRPLISYTIEQALASRYLDGIFVSTDDKKISEVSEKCGASIIKRPACLAEDDSTTIDVMKHAVESIEEKENISVDHIILLQPTTPARRVEDIEGAIELFFDREADSVVSGINAPHSYNPFWAKKIVNGRLKLMFEGDIKATRRQDLPDIFWHNGQIYIIKKELLFEHGDWYRGKCLPYVCPEETFLNIDTKEELRLAEDTIYAQRRERVENITFILDEKKIGHQHPCFIIAEAGVNHNGDMGLAVRMVDAAAEAGVDAVKFQFFDPAGVSTPETGIAEYQRENLQENKNQQEMLNELVLSESDLKRLKAHAEGKGLIFMCTSHSGINEYAKLDEMGVRVHKVGSGDLLNLPVLKYLAGTGKPIILGTGMSTMEEVQTAYRFLIKHGNAQVIFLHCTTDYPCPFEGINMNAMLTMKKELDCPVGYSDHSLGDEVPIMAVALGACVLEKHFTLDRALPGPDHNASILPGDLKTMVEKIRNMEKARGSFDKKPVERERETAKVARKSIVYTSDLPEGRVISESDITIKRPGTGLSPTRYYGLIGKRLIKAVSKDQLAALDDFSV